MWQTVWAIVVSWQTALTLNYKKYITLFSLWNNHLLPLSSPTLTPETLWCWHCVRLFTLILSAWVSDGGHQRFRGSLLVAVCSLLLCLSADPNRLPLCLCMWVCVYSECPRCKRCVQTNSGCNENTHAAVRCVCVRFLPKSTLDDPLRWRALCWGFLLTHRCDRGFTMSVSSWTTLMLAALSASHLPP